MNLFIEQDKSGLWYITSPVIGLMVVGKTRHEVFCKVDGAIEELRKAREAREVMALCSVDDL